MQPVKTKVQVHELSGSTGGGVIVEAADQFYDKVRFFVKEDNVPDIWEWLDITIEPHVESGHETQS